MLLEDFRGPWLSFELIYFRNSFCCRIENSWGLRYKSLGHVAPLRKSLYFLSPLVSLRFEDFLSFLFVLKLSYSTPFHNTLNYASTANIEEVMKFYNLVDKIFETDFSWAYKVGELWHFLYYACPSKNFSTNLAKRLAPHTLQDSVPARPEHVVSISLRVFEISSNFENQRSLQTGLEEL